MAIKILKAPLSGSAGKEATAQANIQKPGIVGVFHAGRFSNGQEYLVLPYMVGGSLRGRIKSISGGLSPELASKVIRDVARAIDYVHRQNLVHGDLKPENVLFDEDDQPHVTDFGVATTIAHLHEGYALGGTLAYASPEQVRRLEGQRSNIGPSSDIWSLGVVMFELLTGYVPFVRGSRDQLMEAIARDEPPPLWERSTDRSRSAKLQQLNPIVAKCLSKHPVARFTTAAELAAALDKLMESWQATPRPLVFSRKAAFDREALEKGLFCDRPWVFEHIDAWTVESKPGLLITGGWGTGKSALAAAIVRHGSPFYERVLAYHFCDSLTQKSESLSPARFVQSIAGMIAARLPEYAAMLGDRGINDWLTLDACERDSIAAFSNAIMLPLAKCKPPGDGVYFLVVDGLDEARLFSRDDERSTIGDILSAFTEQFPPWLRFILTARRQPETLRQFEILGPPLDLGSRRREVRDDAHRCIRKMFDHSPNLAEWLQQSGLSLDDATATILEKSEANFLYLTLLFKAVERSDSHFRLERLANLPAGLDQFLERFLSRHFRDRESFEPARAILEVILASAEPPSIELISAATGLDPNDDVRVILDNLADFLEPIEGSEGRARYGIVHGMLPAWLTQTGAHQYRCKLARGHERLASAGWREYESGATRLSHYFVNHLPRHLEVIGRWTDLEKLILDPPFLEAIAAISEAADAILIELANSLSRLAERGENDRRRLLRLMNEALRLELPFLGRHPSCIFQSLWNTLWWHDAPGIDQQYESHPPNQSSNLHRGASLRSVSAFLERWRDWKDKSTPGFVWLRSLRPLFDAPTGSRVILPGHARDIVAAAITSKPPRAVTATRDGVLHLWDSERGIRLGCEDAGKPIKQIFLLRDGERAIVAFDDGSVIIWKFGNHDHGGVTHTFCQPGRKVQSVELSQSGRRLAVAAEDNGDTSRDEASHVQCFDVQSGRILAKFKVSLPAYLLEFSPDDEHLAVILRGWSGEALRQHLVDAELIALEPYIKSQSGATIELWSLASPSRRLWGRACGVTRKQHTDGVQLVLGDSVNATYFPTDHCLVTERAGGKIEAWDLKSGALLDPRHPRYSSNLSAFSDDETPITTWPPSESRLLAISEDRSSEVVRNSRTTAEIIHKQSAGECPRQRVGRDEGGVWVQIDDRCIAQQFVHQKPSAWRVWDWITVSDLGKFQLHEGRNLLAVDSSGTIALAEDESGALRAIKTTDTESSVLLASASMWTCVALAPDGSLAAIGTERGDLETVDPNSGSARAVLKAPISIRAIAFSPTGTELATTDGDILGLWSLAASTCLCELGLDSSASCDARRVAFSPKGERQIVWSANELLICDARNREVVRRLELHEVKQLALNEWYPQALAIPFAFSMDANRIWVADGKSFRLFDLSTGQQLDDASASPLLTLRNSHDTCVIREESNSAVAFFHKFSRLGAIMPDGRTVVLAHASSGRLEILRLEGEFR